MTRRRPVARHLAALAGMAMLLSVATTAGAASQPSATGNAQAIALYRAAANATNALPAFIINQTGYVRISTTIGKPDRLNWAWGMDQWHRGYYPAREHIVLVQSHGHTDWIEDTLVPMDASCGDSCLHVFPIQFFITRGGAFAGIVLSGSNAPCFQHEKLSRVPYGVGTRWWFAYGHFAPLTHSGAITTVTSRYPNEGQWQTEVDGVTTKSHHFVRSTFRIAPRGKLRGFSFHQVDGVPSALPAVPDIEICS